MQLSNIKIGILNDICRRQVWPNVPMELDILVINLRTPVGICKLKEEFNPGMIIINRGTPVWVMKKIEDECIEYNIPYHSILNSGYFKLEI